jgi:hypothetical protein
VGDLKIAKYLGTVSATEGVAFTLAPTTDDGILDNIMGAVTAPFMADGEFIDASGVMWAIIVWGIIICAATSLYTRSRVASGADPVLRFFF